MENEKWHWQEPGTWRGIGIYHVTMVVSSRENMNACVLAARKGAVMVSPFISPYERRIQAKLLEEGLPFICIADNGFGKYYKPVDGLFDGVAAGKVLILSPWEYDPQKGHVTREECVAMNKLAEEICEGLSK